MTEKSLTDDALFFLDENYKRVTENIAAAALKSGRKADEVRLMAVTKTVKPALINRVIDLGADLIGENKVQELLDKLEFISAAKTEIHIIGHLQTNKVRKIINTVSMIESVDSVLLAREISRRALICGKTMEILLEVNIGGEASKTGFSVSELDSCACEIAELPGIKIKGLMCVPPICETQPQARGYFEKTKLLYDALALSLKEKAQLSVLSMGMSDDYEAAVLEGATLVRIGSALFGKRIY